MHDHASITRFIEVRFGLPSLTGRDANALPSNITATTTVPASALSQFGQTDVKLGCRLTSMVGGF